MIDEYIKRTIDNRNNTSYIIDNNVTLDSCKDNMIKRLNKKMNIDYKDDDWNKGYTQAMIDVFNLMNGHETWDN